jgi:hypothetical protein
MIRRLFILFVFTVTVAMAAFGQNIFGREDILVLAHEAQKNAPKAASHVWNETDKFMAEIAPSAGSEDPTCSFDSLDWAITVYSA